MTFSALNTLITLGDDLELSSLRQLQLDDCSFTATFQDYENDVRFLYSACCISYILNDWSGINIPKACEFLRKCLVIKPFIDLNPS